MKIFLDISVRNTARWRRLFTKILLLLLLAISHEVGAQTMTASGIDAGRDAAADPAPEVSLAHRQAVLAEFKEKLAGFTLSANQDFDFAAFMQLYSDTAAKMAQEEVDRGVDVKLKGLARKTLASREKDREQLKRWIDRFDILTALTSAVTAIVQPYAASTAF
jgi:uncharacterized protein (DUF305 family)